MILLDTNVLSEAMRVEPDGRVMRWLDGHPPSVLFLSAVTVDEILFGIEILPPGRKRECRAPSSRESGPARSRFAPRRMSRLTGADQCCRWRR